MAQCEPLELHLNPLEGSSIWTGDANQEMSYLKATSFLGGLRFWTEALLRAQGQYVHNDMDSCLHDPPKNKIACAACQIFGCTGLGRSFALKVDNTDFRTQPYQGKYDKKKQSLDVVPILLKGSKPSYVLRKAYDGSVKLNFAIQRAVQEVGCEKVLFTLSPTLLRATLLMLEYGTLGAYDQYGCGFVNFAEQEQLKILRQEALATPICYAKNPRESRGTSLKDFFFFQGKVKNNNEETPFIIRHEIRNKLRSMNNIALRHWFCGFMDQTKPPKEKPSGSNYNLCVTFSGNLYGWGYFPYHKSFSPDRDTVLTYVKNTFEQYCGDTLKWKEFNAHQRDNCNSSDNIDGYIKNMLTTPWKE